MPKHLAVCGFLYHEVHLLDNTLALTRTGILRTQVPFPRPTIRKTLVHTTLSSTSPPDISKSNTEVKENHARGTVFI